MILTSHQPNFVPYMGVFYKAYQSDILVLSDDVQYSKSGMHSWNRIYTANGERKITLPVSAHHDMALKDIDVCQPGYNLPKLVKMLRQEYGKAPCFREAEGILNLFEEAAGKEQLKMADFNISIILYLLEKFGITAKVLLASKDLQVSGHKDERIFQMCENAGADVYYSGTGAKVYHIDAEYEKRGIELVYSNYEPIVYEQVHGEFVPNLSVLDYIFNRGYELPKEWK